MNVWYLGFGLIVIVAGGVLAMAIKKVPEGQSFTVNRMGRFHRILRPGIHIITPFLDRIAHRVSTMGRVLDVSCVELQTKDDRPIEAQGLVYFQVLDARKAADHHGGLDEAAQDLARTKAHELVEQMTYDSLNQRTSSELNTWLLGLLNQSSSEWGVRVTRIQLTFEQSDPDNLS